MSEKLLINVAHEETRVALVESGRLSNFEIVTSRADNNKGNIYKGIVHRVNASLQAAFVDYGAEKQGFLPLGELIPDLYPKGQANKRLPIQDVLSQGQELMVQVVKDEIGQKGAGLTTSISIAGRSLALEASSDKAGISRRVSDDDRKRLKKELNQLEVPEGHGIIMRTAAAEQDSETIQDNKKYVEQLLAKARERFRNQRGPGLVHQERSLPLRAIRDYVSSAVDEIVIDHQETYDEVRNFCTVVAPEFVSRIKFYEDPRPLFSRFQIEDQIDDIFARRIDLPSGGSIVIDQTEALVAIDVNSGRVKTDDIEQTALNETTDLKLALMAESVDGGWTDAREVVRGKLPDGFHPLVVSERPAFDSVRIWCDQLRVADHEQPNIAIVHALSADSVPALLKRLVKVEQEEEVTRLPLLVILPEEHNQLDTQLGPQSHLLLQMPLLESRLVQAIGSLDAESTGRKVA